MNDVAARNGSADPGTVVERVETLSCDAAWRNYYFLKITTADGVVGWAEYDEGFSSPGLTTAIEALAPLVVGRSVFDHEPVYQYLFARTRQAASGVIGEALGAIENALLDAKARTLGVPCYDLLGGKVRDRIRVYWSHCGTWRINLGHIYGNRITDLDGVRALGAEVAEKGFTALKTNIFRQTPDGLRGWLPGFGTPFAPELNVSRQLIDEIRATLQAFRDGAGDSMDLLLDLNFNARTEGYARIAAELADFGLFWIEIDTDHPDAMAHIRSKAGCTISGAESLFGVRELYPYLVAGSLDVPIIDGIWNGFWQSSKMASMADGMGHSVAPHNFYGHLATMMNAHWAAATPNIIIMETDIDRIAWDDEIVTVAPDYVDGHLVLGDAPGWGTEPVEEALAAHPPRLSGLRDRRPPAGDD